MVEPREMGSRASPSIILRNTWPQQYFPRAGFEVNRFAQATLSPFLNFHRPCLFATEYRDA